MPSPARTECFNYGRHQYPATAHRLALIRPCGLGGYSVKARTTLFISVPSGMNSPVAGLKRATLALAPESQTEKQPLTNNSPAVVAIALEASVMHTRNPGMIDTNRMDHAYRYLNLLIKVAQR